MAAGYRRINSAAQPRATAVVLTASAVFGLLFGLSQPAPAEDAPFWSEQFRRSGLVGEVRHLYSSGGRLYVSGSFFLRDRSEALLWWDGEEWRPPLDPDQFYVRDLAADVDRLFVSGWIPQSAGLRRAVGWVDSEGLHEFSLPESLFASGIFGVDQGSPVLRSSDDARLSVLRADGWKTLASSDASSWVQLKCVSPEFVCAARILSDSDPVSRFQLMSISGDSLVARSAPLPGSLLSGVSREDGDWVLSENYGAEDRPSLRRWRNGSWTDLDLRAIGESVVTDLAGDAGMLMVQCYDLATGERENYEVDPETLTLRPSAIRVWPPFAAVVDMVEWGGGRVVAGDFTAVNQVGTSAVAFVSDSGCAPLGRGEAPDGNVDELQPTPEGLWCAGEFTTVGSLWSPRIARWDGGNWFAPPALPWNTTADLDFDGQRLRAFGSSSSSQGAADTLAATWNGFGWDLETFDTEPASWSVARGASCGGRVFVAGTFTTGGGAQSVLAQLEEHRWHVREDAPKGSASCLAVSPWGVAVGGSLSETDAPSTLRQAIAVLRDGSWRLVDGPFREFARPGSAPVRDVAIWGDLVLIAGRFDFAGEIYSPGIVAWDGARFLPFTQAESGDWLPSEVDRLWIDGGFLHATGRFVDEVGYPYWGLFRWTGEHWTVLGDPGQYVRSVAVHQGHLYAGLDCCSGYEAGYLLKSRAPLDSGASARLAVGLSVEPNPVRDGVRVRFSGPITPGARWSIVDVAGRRRAGGSVEPSDSVPRVLVLDRAQMDRAGIKGGVYFVRLEQGGRSMAATMVVLR